MSKAAQRRRSEQQKRVKWVKQGHPGISNAFIGNTRIPRVNGVVSFNVLTETGKVLDIVQRDPAPGPTRVDAQDVASLPFDTYEPGFFIAVLPYKTLVNKQLGFYVREGTLQNQAQAVVQQFQCTAITGNLLRASAYCSWDRALQHFKDITDYFGFAVIAFSTPRNLQILAEDPEHYGQYARSVA